MTRVVLPLFLVHMVRLAERQKNGYTKPWQKYNLEHKLQCSTSFRKTETQIGGVLYFVEQKGETQRVYT